MSSRLRSLARLARAAATVYPQGRVTKVVGLTIEAAGLTCPVGQLCRVTAGDHSLLCEAIGFRDDRILLMPLGRLDGVPPGAPVFALGERLEVAVGEALLGQVLDGLGRPLAGASGPVQPLPTRYPVHRDAPSPLVRRPIVEALSVGVRAIDGLLTCGRGQRLGIFAGSGVGKSTLLGMMARHTAADVIVVALIGERGREVREFLERDLGPRGLQRSVVVAATSDEPPLVRIKAAYVATAIAEYFRDRGADVLLLMDSVTRFAMAAREVGLAAGEPPTARGYTPSVFAELPRLLERAGRFGSGSITGFYTVLVEGDDLTEPITDAVRGILDGHIVLDRDLAARNHYPAIAVLDSVSRLMPHLVDGEHLAAAAHLRALLAAHRDGRDLVDIGAYRRGSNALLDEALDRWADIQRYLCQATDEATTLEQARRELVQLTDKSAPPSTGSATADVA
ncbi:MAG TPA: FliI/YscN family ATPase [Bacillota bacterium]